MIDNADKDKNCRVYDKNFSIKIYMVKIDEYEFKPKVLKADKYKPLDIKLKESKLKQKDDSDEAESEDADSGDENADE